MSAVNKLSSKRDSPKNSSVVLSSKNSKENPNPSGSIITALVLVAVLAALGGIVFHFFKSKKKPLQKSSEVKDKDVSS